MKMVEVRFGGNEEKEPGTLFGFKGRQRHRALVSSPPYEPI